MTLYSMMQLPTGKKARAMEVTRKPASKSRKMVENGKQKNVTKTITSFVASMVLTVELNLEISSPYHHPLAIMV